MKKFTIVTLGLALITTPIQQLEACTSPNVEEKAIFKCLTGCDYDTVIPVWTCSASSGNYKLHVAVTAAGSGGTFAVILRDLTPHPDEEILSEFFTATGNCTSGDFIVALVNGHQYELTVDGFSGIGCTVGDHAWAKMCYTCPGS